MPLDLKVFSTHWAVLEDRFGRKHGQPVTMEYYAILAAELGTGEFELAARRSFRHDSFFPSPQTLIDYARGSAKQQSHDAWTLVYEAAMRGEGVPDVDPLTLKAVRAIGGTRELGLTPTDKIPYLRRDFLAVYEEAAKRGTERDALPDAARKALFNG